MKNLLITILLLASLTTAFAQTNLTIKSELITNKWTTSQDYSSGNLVPTIGMDWTSVFSNRVATIIVDGQTNRIILSSVAISTTVVSWHSHIVKDNEITNSYNFNLKRPYFIDPQNGMAIPNDDCDCIVVTNESDDVPQFELKPL